MADLGNITARAEQHQDFAGRYNLIWDVSAGTTGDEFNTCTLLIPDRIKSAQLVWMVVLQDTAAATERDLDAQKERCALTHAPRVDVGGAGTYMVAVSEEGSRTFLNIAATGNLVWPFTCLAQTPLPIRGIDGLILGLPPVDDNGVPTADYKVFAVLSPVALQT